MVDRENIFVINLNHVAVVWGTNLPGHLLAPGVRLQIVPLKDSKSKVNVMNNDNNDLPIAACT